MQVADIVVVAVYVFMIYCSILWLTLFFKNRKRIFSEPRPKKLHSITFLLPAYNEEKKISECLEKILSLNYPKEKLKVIVIDDGSTDNTVKMARKYKDVKVLKQKHAGKAAALNHGLKHVTTELVACMDADSFPDANYLYKLVGLFQKREVAAATPAIKVVNVDSWIRKIQWMEYLFQIFLRKLFSIFECEYVVPGPGGIYRTSVVREIGGWDGSSLTEDMEITFRLRDRGYRLANSIDAYTYTNAPKSFMGLWNQRIRWYRGYLENVRRYSHMIGNLKYGNFGFFILPANFFWIFCLGFLLFSSLYNSIRDIVNYFIAWNYMNYLIIPPEIEVSVLWLSSFSFFHVFFLFLGLFSICLSISLSKERIGLMKKFDRYLLFLFIYPILISLWWVVAAFCEVLRVSKKW
ncbi:MAG: glycosyltransferase [Candidatus Aenigmarchaeota archaeon]|nr:glycosyltransferase [Candidatus Aenigmarchaeota archaeon]